jgi:prevent-host-death family protein
MTEVGVEILKDRLSEYLDRAREGERILITERGQSIALLGPIEGSEATKRAWKLVESGVASWKGGKPKGSHPRPRVKGKNISAVVLEDRR